MDTLERVCCCELIKEMSCCRKYITADVVVRIRMVDAVNTKGSVAGYMLVIGHVNMVGHGRLKIVNVKSSGTLQCNLNYNVT
mmetsp:Transcript_18917/g.31685  ORF Transcript_18917/g.31685 Transcript_18917/m.31685 type:complete len:82 (+) Transcript_18917:675-920(+)